MKIRGALPAYQKGLTTRQLAAFGVQCSLERRKRHIWGPVAPDPPLLATSCHVPHMMQPPCLPFLLGNGADPCLSGLHGMGS